MSNKTQSKALYVCLILMLITGSIFVAVAFGAGRRARPETEAETYEQSVSEDDPKPRETEKKEESTTALRETVSKDESKKPTVDEVPEESVSASVSIEDIVFTSPVDGAVIVPCSLTVPVYSVTMNDYRTHMGIDFASAVGDSVAACADGEITSVFDDPMMGTTVVVTHGDGIESVYKNLSDELPDGIGEGVKVDAGDVIGVVGESALIECEEEPHLHFELSVNGTQVDPTEYIETVSINEVYED